MALTDGESKKKGFFMVFAIFFIIAILSFLMGGIGGIFSILKWFIYASLIIGFLGLVFYVVYYLFFKPHRIDITYENKKDYIQSAKDNGADMINDIYLTGDKNHSAKKFMTVTGYLRILSFDNKEFDLFVGKRSTANPFEEDKVIMLEPKQHSDLIGDVYIYGISLIQKYGYYFLNSSMMDYNAIDKQVAQDTFRTVMYYNLGDMKGLIDRATGLDPDYAKERQREKLLKIPVLSGQEGNR